MDIVLNIDDLIHWLGHKIQKWAPKKRTNKLTLAHLLSATEIVSCCDATSNLTIYIYIYGGQ